MTPSTAAGEKRIVLSLCDRTGNMVRPWAEAGYDCFCVDTQHDGVRTEGRTTFVGADVTDYLPPRGDYRIAFAFPPCTHLANSGNRWKADKGLDALIEALPIVRACRRILDWTGAPWMLENPVGSLSTYWRKPDHTCHPWHFGENEQKLTCLWTGGGFVMPAKLVTTRPADVKQSVWLAPPSDDRADIRSVTPAAFARAVFMANEHPPGHGAFDGLTVRQWPKVQAVLQMEVGRGFERGRPDPREEGLRAMAETKHTPGPWEAGLHPANPEMNIVNPIMFGNRMGKLPDWEGGHSFIRNAADARLIAAAPDLLKAAKRALVVLKAQGESVRPGNVLGALAAAISKAEATPDAP